ncbi:MAG: type I-U CRISPR-associated protein Csx17 [Chloroflexota bacterium]|nr:type I-U CRISPR-associated protein Csx17 [Chloroflexota bacterium]
MTNDIALNGCDPGILQQHMKALGIFRAVALQADTAVLAKWTNGAFILRTKLSEDELNIFFRDKYAVPAVLSPWNKDSAFYDKRTDDGSDIMGRVLGKPDPRLDKYADAMRECISALEKFGYDAGDRKMPSLTKDEKTRLLGLLRSVLPEHALDWLDAAAVPRPGSDKFDTVPILMSGGNDGRVDMSKKFITSALTFLLDTDELCRLEYVKNSLYGERVQLTSAGSSGPFHPGAYSDIATGPMNDKARSLYNPLDMVLSMEGVLMFAGHASRQGQGHNARKFAAFPFSLPSTMAGYDTACDENEKEKGELWIPTWSNFATHGEMCHVFREGRVQASPGMPSSGTKFAAALANYGAAKGLYEFHRFGVFERKGRAHHVVCVGSLKVPVNTGGNSGATAAGNTNEESGGELVAELDGWLSAISKKRSKLPDAANRALRAVEGSIIRYCAKDHEPPGLVRVLIAVGYLERHLMLGASEHTRPVSRLSSEWITRSAVDAAEHRLAVALAGLHGGRPIRENLESVVRGKNQNTLAWGRDGGARGAVGDGGGLVRTMLRVLRRRYIDAPAGGDGRHPHALAYARVDDVMDFVEGRTDDKMIHDLWLPMSMVDYSDLPKDAAYARLRLPNFVPEPYMCLKANFPPIPAKNGGGGQIAYEPAVNGLLAAGRLNDALIIMRRRLRIAGYKTGVTDMPSDAARSASVAYTKRLHAAMLFPIKTDDLIYMIDSVRKT